MISKSGINRTKLKVALISNIVCFLRDFFLLKPAMWCEGISHPHHDFALSSFNNQVGINFWKKSIQCSSSYLRAVASAISTRFSGKSILLNIGSSSFLVNPIYNRFLIVRDFNVGMVIHAIFSGFSSEEANKKTAFSINNSCKISKLCIFHKTPLLKTNEYATKSNICTA